MSSLFAGLDKFGLGKLEKSAVFNEEKNANGTEKKVEKPQVTEEDILFDKTFTCPICDTEFHSKMVKTGKVKLLSADSDLRPKYQTVDSLKYDALVCPKCGYAALSRFFKFIMPAQAKMIKEKISANFTGLPKAGNNIYTYDDAIARHKLALINAIVKQAKNSEKAYTCLKLAWLYRGKAETLPKNTLNYDKVLLELRKNEFESLQNAYEGFTMAFSKETFPMCGMDENTVTYLVAELARRTGKYDACSRWLSKVLISRDASERIKSKARTVKEQLAIDVKRAEERRKLKQR